VVPALSKKMYQVHTDYPPPCTQWTIDRHICPNMVQFCSKIASTLEVLTLKLCPRRLNHGDFRSHLLLTLRHAPNLRCVSIGRASNPTVFSSLACLTQIKQLMLGDLDIQSDGHSPSVQHLSCLRSLEELQLQRLSADDDWAEPSEEVASSMCRALSKLLKLRSVKMEFCYIQDVPSDYDVSSGFMASVSLLTKIRYFLGFSKLLQPRMRGLVIAVRISAGPPPPLTSKIG